MQEQSSSPPTSPRSTGGVSRPFDVPKEVYRLVDHLFKYGMEQVIIFQYHINKVALPLLPQVVREDCLYVSRNYMGLHIRHVY